VAADVLVRSDGSRFAWSGGARFAWLVSHAPDTVAVKPQLAAGSQLQPLGGELSNGIVALEPFRVAVFRRAVFRLADGVR
jgi:hypothetical protein